MNDSIIQRIAVDVDIGSGLVQYPLRTELMSGDKNANRITARVYKDKNPISIDGMTVSGDFIRPSDEAKIKLDGEAHGNEASVLLNEACYLEDGYFEVVISLEQGTTRRSILKVTGTVARKGSGAIIDVSGVIPSIDDIVAQYDEMKRVTKDAMDAAQMALDASEQANFTILDRFETYAQLIAAHPTGNAGEAFAVGTTEENVVYIWGIDTLAWVNIGAVQGAQGPRGPQGIQAKEVKLARPVRQAHKAQKAHRVSPDTARKSARRRSPEATESRSRQQIRF